jgi:hypothetical protein
VGGDVGKRVLKKIQSRHEEKNMNENHVSEKREKN